MPRHKSDRPGNKGRGNPTYRLSCRGLMLVKVEETAVGPEVTVYARTEMVRPADREMAADWLKQFLPNMTHDERYDAIWEG
jgi:hypothetical protein